NGGPHSIKLVVDATAKDYDYYRNGTLIASNQNWVSAGGTQDQIRIAARQYHQGQPVFTYDDLKLTLSVSDATENALGDEQVRTFIDDTQAEFDAGTYTATQYDAPNTWVELTATGQTSGTGTYASKIFDGGASATWDTLQWLPQRPSLKELPNNTGANDWWDNAYPFRKKITFGTSHSALSLGHTVSFTMDTQPATTSVELTSGNDVRIIWLPTAGLPVELDRIGSVWNSATTSIDFRLQSAISANLNEDTDGSYYVYYGNAAAGTPPSNEMNVYYFADFFNRANSSTIGNGWTEWTTGGGNVSIASNATSVVGNNQGPADAGIKQTFPLGALPGNFTLNFDWTMPVNTEGEWTHYLNIGNSSSMSNASRTTGVGPGIYNGEGGHFSPNGVENVSNDLTGNMENSVNGGPHAIRIVVNTSAQTYSYYRNAALVASGQTYVSAQSTLNQVRIATDVYSAGQPAFVYDNLKLTLDVADAPETTTGSEATEPTQSESGYGAGNMTLTSNIGLWHLNESSGTIADSSGNGNTGTLSGASYGASGRFNTALDFDGVDDFVSVPDSQTLDITGKLTLSAWVYADTTPELFDSPIIKTTDNDAWLDGYGMYFEGGLIKFWVDRYDTNVATASFSTGVWHHVVGTYDGANVRIYVDGVAGSVDPYAGAVTTNNTAMFIGAGADASGAGYFWDGKVDEVALFRRSLSATEVSDLYKRGAVRFKYLVRSCNDAACSGESFIGPDGTASTFYSELTNTTLTPPAAIALTNVTANRYFQYQTTLETSSSTLSPELKTVTVTLTPSGSSGYVTAGSFQSSAFNMTDNSPVEILEWDQSIPSCTPTCTIKLQVRTAPDASGSPGTWTAWYGATGSGTYFTTNTGTRIPLFLNGNRWVQYRVELAGDGVNTPTLQETRLFYR
ncbi:MAG: LamG domain-containing protein, partial [Patescibacteria group bacterium]